MNCMSEIEIMNQEEDFPKGFFTLHSSVKIASHFDNFTLLLHSSLLETGFIPNDVAVDNIYHAMPENWNSNGIFKVQYYHKTTPEVVCCVTCVPLGKQLTIQGCLTNESSAENSVHKNLSIKGYINEEENVLNALKLFIQVEDLTRTLKDEFCFALLVLIQQSVNYEPAFGLNGLVEDVEISLMKLLPVEAVVALSGVNMHFHRQANMPIVWKFLFERDFRTVPSASNSSCSTEENWKDLYKLEYLKRKRQKESSSRPRAYVHPAQYFPPMFPNPMPNYGFDPRINMDPALQIMFPQMRSRFSRSDWPYGWDNRFQYFRSFW